MRRRTILVIVIAMAVVIVAIPIAAYGYLVWTTRDAPEKAALDAAPERSPAGGPAAIDGTWTVSSVATNFAGYRIRERLGPVPAPSDAVGRTDAVQGTIGIEDGQLSVVDITIDMTSIRSDSSGRDDRLRTQALETDRFPTASFRVAEPLELGTARRGEVIRVRVPGELTLHGVTRPAVFAVQARWNGPTIQAAGTTSIERGDFDIEVDSLGYSIDGTGTIEFELTFAPQGAEATATPPSTLVDNPETPTPDDEPAPCQAGGAASPDLTTPMLVTMSTGDEVEFAGVGVIAAAEQATIIQRSAGYFAGASWSPDGNEVVSAGAATPQVLPTLAVVPAGGGAPRTLAGIEDVGRPDWGPDGRIVYVQEAPDGRSDLWVVDADGSDARLLVATPGRDADPRWSPDGRSIVFTTTSNDTNQDVVIVDRDGQGLRTIATGKTYEYAPSFTPDGRGVVFVREGSIYRMRTDGTGRRRLTRGPDDGNPAISPDGTQLGFIRSGSLFVAGADGSEPRCVVTNQQIGGGPRWRPE